MASLPNTKLLSYEEWLQMPEVKDEEVVNGEIRIMPMAKASHAIIIDNIYSDLRTQIERSRFNVLTGSFGIVISVSPLTCRNPDLAVFDRTDAVIVDGYYRCAPHLAIKVLSPRNTPKDIRLKTAEYAAIGLPELWVVSQSPRTIEVLLLENGALRRNAIVAEGVLRPTRFPQVAIDIASIWPE
jgi:Uma2 family endonuclease